MLPRAKICLLVAAIACAIAAAPGLGATTISGNDGAVWHDTTTATYTITASAPGGAIKCGFRGGDSGEPDDPNNTGQSPLTIALPGLSAATGYRLVARETRDHEDDRTRRLFVVDTTPPRVQIDTPAPGAVYAQG